MLATSIRMMPGCSNSQNLLEIDEIFIYGCTNPGYYKKARIHDHLMQYPGSIQVNIQPFPQLIPQTSKYGEKYVRSTPNETSVDNLLNLPRT